MGFDRQKISGRSKEEDKSFFKKLLPKKKKDHKEKKAQKKRRKIKETLVAAFQAVTARAGALVDYFVRSRAVLGKIALEGSGMGKAINEQKGYYSQEELNNFGLAAAHAMKEEKDLRETVGTMERVSRRQIELQSTAGHLKSYFHSEIQNSYTRFTKAIDPLILRPKTNISKAKKDNSDHSFGKRVAATLLLGANLLNGYQKAENDMHSLSLELRGMSTVVSANQEPTYQLCPRVTKSAWKIPSKKKKS